MKRLVYYSFIVVALVGAVGLSYTVSRPETVFAATDAASCKSEASISGVSTGGVSAVSRACDLCYGDELRQSRGALWMSNQGPGIALVLADRNVGGRDKTATFDVYGQVFSCGHGETRSYTAYNVSLQNSGGVAIPEITSVGDVGRGSTSGTYSWSEGGSTSGHKITDLDSFFSTESTCTSLGNGARECTRNVNVYRCFSPGSGCYPDPSTVRAIINDTTNDENKNRFYSKSTVEIPAQGSDISGYSATSDKDGSARVEISTDERTVTVNFKHELFYEVTSPFGANDTVQEPSVSWKIRKKSGKKSGWDDVEWQDKTGNNSTGTWTSPSGKENKSSGMTIGNDTVTVTFTENESGVEKRVCRRVRYEKKYIDFIVDGLAGAGYNWVVEGGKSYENSQACAYITYVSSDEGKDPLANAEVGLTGTENYPVMLAGEDASLSINGSAQGIMTRRLIGKEAVVFNHGAGVLYNADLVAGTTRFQGTNLCNLFWGRTPAPLACKTLSRYTVDYTDAAEGGAKGSDTTGAGATVAVPDDIGQKYCNSFGYKFRYFYGVRANGATTTNWTSEPAKDYTYVAQPACRTIAKKPTTAFWNGSVLVANNSIVMSLAKRHVINGSGPELGYMTPAETGILENAEKQPVVGDVRKLYGSWAEYIAASGSAMEHKTAIASGSSISHGSEVTAVAANAVCSNTSAPWSTNSSLTISNVGCDLAGAQANLSSSAFRTRLTAYLEKASDDNLANGTQIIGTSNQDYTISTNIINDGEYSIRTLPQTIIFANNVNIAGNVTRIDAWIIAKGKVNTCADFVAGTTPGTGTTSDGVGVRSNACNNQLVFNGPVVAGKLELNRTFGADSQAQMTSGISTTGVSGWSTRESSAEVFNLRADAYLWAYAQAARYGSSYNEAYSRELAPRY